jgi:LysR family transcriptional regulator, glycine cleavage system transcriptional activator
MGRRLPPLPAIEAFLFAARSSSFRAAARQLALSPSAFSRRLQTLEAFTGITLFERSAPPTLTEAGRRYYQAIGGPLDEILAATEALRVIPDDQRVLLMLPPSLAMNWLMPRLSHFIDRHPELEVDIVIGTDLNTLRLGKADIAVASNLRDFTGLPTDQMVALEAVVVAPRALAAGRPPPGSLNELSKYKLLGLENPGDFWTRWLSRAGYEGPSVRDPVRYETWCLMYEAAANGFGLTIAVSALANGYLREGRLSPCFDISLKYNDGYRIAYASPKTQSRAGVRCLSAWLAEEMLQSRDEFRTLTRRSASSDGQHRPL